MKALAGILLVIAAIIPGVNDIATVNKLKKDAEKAYLAGDYAKAAQAYTMLTDSLGVLEDKLFLNLGHSLFQQGDSAQAFSQYQRLINTKEKDLKSVAYNQMGIISSKPGDRNTALSFFKEALKADPTNEEARYNYQLVKRQIAEENEKNQDDQQQDKEKNEEKEDEKKDQQNQQDKDQNNDQKNEEQKKQDQEKKDQESENKEQKDQEQKSEEQKKEEQQKKDEEQKKKEQQEAEQQDKENKDGEKQPPQINPDKLKEMNISEEKAKMILEAMRNSEIQYIQQNKRKGVKKPESGKPDW
jgi:tetratricopeptide (TPR) repeat protein